MYENRGGGLPLEGAPTTSVAPEDARSLLSTADAVADEIRDHLSDAFSVDSTVVATPYGPQGAVSVHLPEAEPVAIGISMNDHEDLSSTERRELAHDLIAAAVGQAQVTIGDRIVDAAQ